MEKSAQCLIIITYFLIIIIIIIIIITLLLHLLLLLHLFGASADFYRGFASEARVSCLSI